MIRCTRYSALLAAIIALPGSTYSSDTKPTNQPEDVASLATRMATHMTQTTGKMWLCGVNKTILAAYLFLPAGQIEGLNPNHQLGMEIDHTRASMADQIQYLWSISSDGSLGGCPRIMIEARV